MPQEDLHMLEVAEESVDTKTPVRRARKKRANRDKTMDSCPVATARTVPFMICVLSIIAIVNGCPNKDNFGCRVNSYQMGDYNYTEIVHNDNDATYSYIVHYLLHNGKMCYYPTYYKYATKQEALAAFNITDYASLHDFEYAIETGQCSKNTGKLAVIWVLGLVGVLMTGPYVRVNTQTRFACESRVRVHTNGVIQHGGVS